MYDVEAPSISVSTTPSEKRRRAWWPLWLCLLCLLLLLLLGVLFGVLAGTGVIGGIKKDGEWA